MCTQLCYHLLLLLLAVVAVLQTVNRDTMTFTLPWKNANRHVSLKFRNAMPLTMYREFIFTVYVAFGLRSWHCVLCRHTLWRMYFHNAMYNLCVQDNV